MFKTHKKTVSERFFPRSDYNTSPSRGVKSKKTEILTYTHHSEKILTHLLLYAVDIFENGLAKTKEKESKLSRERK